MNLLVACMLLVVGAIHLLPLAGVLGVERLEALYGVALDDGNLVLLLRHRAVLFGLLGVFLVSAAFRPAWRPAAFAAGAVSVIAFLVLAGDFDALHAPLQRVYRADLVALACCVVGAIAEWFRRRNHRP